MPNQEPPSPEDSEQGEKDSLEPLNGPAEVGGEVRVGDSQARRTTHDGVGHARDLANESSMDHVPSIVQDKEKSGNVRQITSQVEAAATEIYGKGSPEPGPQPKLHRHDLPRKKVKSRSFDVLGSWSGTKLEQLKRTTSKKKLEAISNGLFTHDP